MFILNFKSCLGIGNLSNKRKINVLKHKIYSFTIICRSVCTECKVRKVNVLMLVKVFNWKCKYMHKLCIATCVAVADIYTRKVIQRKSKVRDELINYSLLQRYLLQVYQEDLFIVPRLEKRLK